MTSINSTNSNPSPALASILVPLVPDSPGASNLANQSTVWKEVKILSIRHDTSQRKVDDCPDPVYNLLFSVDEACTSD